MADNTRERTRAEAQFKKTQKQQEGAAAMAAYVADAEAVRAKTVRLRELDWPKRRPIKRPRISPSKKRRSGNRNAHGVVISPLLVATIQRLPQKTTE